MLHTNILGDYFQDDSVEWPFYMQILVIFKHNFPSMACL